MTSKHFTTEQCFVSLCKTFDKVKIMDGMEYFVSPYPEKKGISGKKIEKRHEEEKKSKDSNPCSETKIYFLGKEE